MPPTKRPAAARQRRFHGPQTRWQARAWFRLSGLRNMHPGGWTPRAPPPCLERAVAGRWRGGMCGEMTGDRRSPPLGKEEAAGRLCVLAMRCVASARTEKRRQSVQGAALWPRRLRADRGKTIRTALIRLLSVVSVPEEKPPTRRRHAAFFVGGLRVVLKRAPVRFPEILLRMFPLRRQRRAPALCPACAFRCRVCPRSREGICAVPRVRRGPRSPGHAGIRALLRAPTGCLRAGRGDRSRTPSRHRNALDRAGRASEQDAGPFMTKESAAGRNAFSGTA